MVHVCMWQLCTYNRIKIHKGYATGGASYKNLPEVFQADTEHSAAIEPNLNHPYSILLR